MNEVSTGTTENPTWWHQLECHLSPRWGLPDLDQYMLHTIKDTYQFELDLTILPDFMTIERLLFSAWVELSHSFFAEKPSTVEAVRLVQNANKYLKTKFDKLGDDRLIGYGTIIYAFLMWIYHKSGSTKEFKKAEEKLKELCKHDLFQSESNKLVPSYQVYIDVTHAWALGRLGSEKKCKALHLLDSALEVNREKKHGSQQWLFAKALIEGNAARETICFDDCQGYESPNLVEMLRKEKQTLKEVVTEKKSTLNLAKAHLGTVMIVLDDITRKAKENDTDGNTKKRTKKTAKPDAEEIDIPTALKYIKESLSHHREDSLELAFILARLNIYLNKTNMLQDILEYCETEINIALENRPSDFYFQLALLYYKQGTLTDETSMMDKALSMVRKAVNSDENHIQARLWEAMMLANLNNPDPRNSERAKEIYSEIPQDYFTNTATEQHILRSISNSSVRYIYKPLQYLQNVFEFLLLCVKRHVVKDYLGHVDFELVVKKDALQGIEILQKEAQSNSGDEKIQIDAMQYLAEINLRLGRYAKAEQLFKLLYTPNELENKVKCGLAKCLYRLGKFQELKTLGEVFYEKNGEANRQGFKDIQEFIILAEGKEKQHEMMAKCEDAIDLGSFEGCLLMLSMRQHFQEKFFVFRERFAHRLAKIKKLCMKRDDSDSQQDSNQSKKQNNESKVKQIIAEKIDSILKYCQRQKIVHESHESVYKKLKEIRRLLLEFEYCLLSEDNSCSTKDGFLKCAERQCNHTKQQFSPGETPVWSEDCRKAAEAVLFKARFLLDEVIGCLQIAARVKDKEKTSTIFPVIACWKIGYENEERAKKELQKRLKSCKLFTGDHGVYIPDSIFDSLLKIQPMFNENNQWLFIFHHFANKLKHGGIELGPVCEHWNGDENFHFQLCTSYLVRRSCEEVEKITLFLLNKCYEMM